jgi:hypothetical protein
MLPQAPCLTMGEATLRGRIKARTSMLRLCRFSLAIIGMVGRTAPAATLPCTNSTVSVLILALSLKVLGSYMIAQAQPQSSALVYDDEIYDKKELAAAHQAKMKSIDKWRYQAHGDSGEVHEPTHSVSHRSQRKIDPPARVSDRQRDEQPRYQYTDTRQTSDRRKADMTHGFAVQGTTARKETYPARLPYSSSRVKSKSTPFLLDTGRPATAGNAYSHYSSQEKRRMWCSVCRQIPPAGTTCHHGVPGPVMIP